MLFQVSSNLIILKLNKHKLYVKYVIRLTGDFWQSPVTVHKTYSKIYYNTGSKCGIILSTTLKTINYYILILFVRAVLKRLGFLSFGNLWGFLKINNKIKFS